MTQSRAPPPAAEPAPATATPLTASAPRGNATKLGKEAFVAFNAGRFVQAVALYTEALECAAVEEKKLIFTNRSAARLRMQQFADAMADAKEAILLDPTWSKGHLRRGEAAAAMSMWLEACAAYREALRLDPDNAAIASKLAEAEEEAEELGEDVDASRGGVAFITPTILPFARPAGQDAVDRKRLERVSPIQAFIKSKDPALCREMDEALHAYFNESRGKAHLVVSAMRRLETLTADNVRRDPRHEERHHFHAIHANIYDTIKKISEGRSSQTPSQPSQSQQVPVNDDILNQIREKTAQVEATAGSVPSDQNMPASLYPTALALFKEVHTLCLAVSQSYVLGTPKAAKQVVARGLIAACKLALSLCSLKDTPSHCMQIKTAAAHIEALMRPSPSADAVCLAGLVQVINNILPSTEGISKLAAALKMRPSQWTDQSSFRNLRQLAENLLTFYRAPLAPLQGNWLSLPMTGLAGRYGPGTTQIGSRLYVFGGIRIPERTADPDPYYSIFQEYRLMHDTGANESVALNDLVCFDFSTNSWEQVLVDGASPPPRGLCILEHDSDDPDSLYLVGGRDSFFVHSRDGQHKNDPNLWHFSIRRGVWTEYKLRAFRMEAEILGSVIFKNKWYIVEQCDHCCHVLCFDLSKKNSPVPAWTEIRASTNGPPLQADVLGSHFFSRKTSTQYIWARPLAAAVEQTRYSEVGGELWGVEFASPPGARGGGGGKGGRSRVTGGSSSSSSSSTPVRISWRKFEVGCETPWTTALPNTFMGPKPLTSGETACAFDEATQRCYIFGGYNEKHHLPAVDLSTGSTTINSGVFNGTVFELDLTRLTCRALESAGGKFPLGPTARAKPFMGVYNRQLLCAGGYRTQDPITGRYGQWHCLEDEWVCVLLPDAPEAAPRAAAASAAGGAGRGGTNRRTIELHQADHQQYTNNAIREVMQNTARRAALAAASPTTERGVVIINVFSTPFPGKPLSLDAVFSPSNMSWLTLPELRARYPMLRREVASADDLETINRIERESAMERIQAIFLVDFALADGKLSSLHCAAANVMPVHTWGFFSRPTAGVLNVYFSEADAAMGKFVASCDAGAKAVDPSTLSGKKAGAKTAVFEVETCSNPTCPRTDLYVQQALLRKGVQEEVQDPALLSHKLGAVKAPKLMRCGVCLIAQYCGAECQKAAWAGHKKECRAASGK